MHPGVGSAREQGITLAEVLDSYNNGLLGPGACEDEDFAIESIETPNTELCTYDLDY